jgi:rhodanese-related sulfurtransferase
MLKKTLVTLVILFAGSVSAQAMDLDVSQVPAAKRTSLGLYISATGAYQKWKADPESVTVIDVRTPEEFRTVGYAKMAERIPLVQSSREFTNQVIKLADPQDTVLVMCRSGNRSAVAVNMLAEHGFKQVYTVVDGFEGDRESDPSSPHYGQRTVNGWKNAGLPWTK